MIAALAWLSQTTAMAEPCAPRVALSGDRDAVAEVAAELTRLGVSLASAEQGGSCPTLKAVVQRDGEGLAVAVASAAQRSEGRVVGDPETAAAWIDSWARDELEVASWAATTPQSAHGFAAPGAVPSDPREVPVAPRGVLGDAHAATTIGAASLAERYALSVVYERSWTDDDTTWDGFAVAACMRVGAACLGGRVRAAFQPDLAYNTTTADRSDLVALATAAVPITVGQVSIAPELGVGVGRSRTTRVEKCSPGTTPTPDPGGNCEDPSDPMCDMTPPPATDCLNAAGLPTNQLYVGDGYDKIEYRPRVAVSVRVAFPIVRHVWLDASAALSLSPWVPSPEDPDVSVDQNVSPMPVEPMRGYQLGVGIRVGAP